MKNNRMRFLNIEIDNITMEESLEIIKNYIITNIKPRYVITPNVDHLVQLEDDNEFRKIYQDADLILTDGMPLIWISKFIKRPIKEKISGSDIFPKICEMSAINGYSIFLLGAAEGVAEKAAENLIKKYRNLNIVGTYSPSYGFQNKPEEIKKIIEIINLKKPDILAVGLGAPKQEKFIYKYKEELKVPVSLGIGATIDFEAGNIKRAPKWMQSHGLEWLYRCTQDPKRLAKRYLKDIKILKLIFKYN